LADALFQKYVTLWHLLLSDQDYLVWQECARWFKHFAKFTYFGENIPAMIPHSCREFIEAVIKCEPIKLQDGLQVTSLDLLYNQSAQLYLDSQSLRALRQWSLDFKSDRRKKRECTDTPLQQNGTSKYLKLNMGHDVERLQHGFRSIKEGFDNLQETLGSRVNADRAQLDWLKAELNSIKSRLASVEEAVTGNSFRYDVSEREFT